MFWDKRQYNRGNDYNITKRIKIHVEKLKENKSNVGRLSVVKNKVNNPLLF